MKQVPLQERSAERFIDIARELTCINDEVGVFTSRVRMNIDRLVSEKKRMKGIEDEILNRTEKNEDVKNAIKGIGTIYIFHSIGDWQYKTV
ncbi:MAG: hypothetical protein QXW80_04620 [Candidatus Micrarchaeia archaeon]